MSSSNFTDTKNPVGPSPQYSYSDVTNHLNGEAFLPSYQPIQQAVPKKRSPLRRFLRATFAAFFVWILFNITVRSFADVMHWAHRDSNGRWSDLAEYPIPDDVKLSHCISEEGWTPVDDDFAMVDHDDSNEIHPGGRYPFASQTTFEFPLSSSSLNLLARGPLSAGKVDIVSDSDQAKDKVKFIVTVRYYREEVRDLAEVCAISREEDDHGVGIFTPRQRHPSRRHGHSLFFETVIILPESDDESPISVKRLTTDVPNTIQRISNLGSKILFESIDIHGTNAPIEAFSVTAYSGKFQSSNGPIRGVFNATGSLELKTSNSPIRVHVGLTSKEDGPASNLTLKTSNGALEGEISLLSNNSSNATYHVDAHTSNSPLGLNFDAAPVNSTLTLYGSTSNSPARASLHPAFEGAFSLATSHFKAEVVGNDTVEDPSGSDRKRKLTYEKVSGQSRVEGKIFWGDEEEGKAKGFVNLHTSNSPVVLKL